MKKFSLLLLLVCMGMCVYAQKYTEIKGFVKDDRLKEIHLYNVEDGSTHLYASTAVAEDGSFGFLFCPSKPGFYTLGNNQRDQMDFVIYVKGNDKINIDILENKAVLNGKNTKENIALYKWEDFAADVRLKSVYFMRTISNYKDFFPEFTVFVSKLDSIKKKIKSGNAEFDALLKKKIDYDVDYYAAYFLQTPRTVHPERGDWPEFYNTIISDSKFTTDEVLQFPQGARMLSIYSTFGHISSGKEYSGPEVYHSTCLSYLKNDRLKGEYVIRNVFPGIKSYDQYLSMLDRYGKYLVTPSQKARVEAIGTALYETAPGKIAADFTYPDVNGKDVSLSDFKGKIVLVDVWATWCGPCRGEIPHLKKLEEEMHGTDVVFLGVSVDEAKDKQKWLDFIKKEELGGIQLHASGWSKIAKDYKIKGIPRFMVFDKQGKIVSVDAPRPSRPELKQMLEEELKK